MGGGVIVKDPARAMSAANAIDVKVKLVVGSAPPSPAVPPECSASTTVMASELDELACFNNREITWLSWLLVD